MSRISLFDELKKGGYESALITTFNVDFPFYEDVVLRRMQSAGIEHHIIMVDSAMCAQAISARPPIKAGYHYSLAPMKCSAAFHPKLLLLLGRDKGLLAVGSHNLTLSGYGNNIELTNVVEYNKKKHPETLSVFQAALEACSVWLHAYGVGLPDGILESFNKIQDSCAWLRESKGSKQNDVIFAYTGTSTPALWEQAKSHIPKKPTLIFGVSAFFDNSLKFVHTLSELKPRQFILGIQSKTVNAPKSILKIDSVNVLECDSLLSDVEQSYIHAKLLYIESKEESVLITGSANLSAPAWVKSGEQANAEAVLIRLGKSAASSFKSLGFGDLKNAVKIKSLPAITSLASSDDNCSPQLLVINYEHGCPLAIPWDKPAKSLSVGYLVDFSVFEPVTHVRKGYEIHIRELDIRPGEILHVRDGDNAVLYILLHHEQRIREYSSTGTERKLRLALGSLNTSKPELDMLFKYVGRLMSGDVERGRRPISKAFGDTKADSGEIESLISNFNDRIRNKSSGRMSLIAGGDIGLILSTLISGLSIASGADNSGINEDRLGRNEEELVGQDDEDLGGIVEQTRNDDIKEFISRKLNSVIVKLDEYLCVHGVNACHAALGVVTFVHHLLKANEDYVTHEELADLFYVLTNNLLSDRDPVVLDALDDQSIYKSDDWGRLMGYVVWLAFYANVAMRNRLPLSAVKEDKDLLIWQNACWLYLAQRVATDKFIYKIAGELITDSKSEKMQQWFSALYNTGKSLNKSGKSLGIGFGLASSPDGKAFSGYRIVTDSDTNQVRLASISGEGIYTSYAKGFLNVI